MFLSNKLASASFYRNTQTVYLQRTLPREEVEEEAEERDAKAR